MPLPQVTGEFGARGRRSVGAFCGCRASQCVVTTSPIVIILEIRELLMKINGIPEERAIEVFAPDRPDQSFDEWMGPAMPNPTMRRVNTSMTTRTQWLRNRSTLHRLSLVCARKVSQEGPMEPVAGVNNFFRARHLFLSGRVPSAVVHLQ